MATGRDAKGRLLKGHTLFGKSYGVKNGRKKTLAGKVKDALQLAEDAMPQLYLDMIRDAKDKKASIRDRQMCREYLSDRIYGRPNQPIEGLGSVMVTFVVGRGYSEKPGETDKT